MRPTALQESYYTNGRNWFERVSPREYIKRLLVIVHLRIIQQSWLCTMYVQSMCIRYVCIHNLTNVQRNVRLVVIPTLCKHQHSRQGRLECQQNEQRCGTWNSCHSYGNARNAARNQEHNTLNNIRCWTQVTTRQQQGENCQNIRATRSNVITPCGQTVQCQRTLQSNTDGHWQFTSQHKLIIRLG